MQFIKKCLLASALLIALPGTVSAQSAATATAPLRATSTTEMKIIADVNVESVVATTTNGVLSGSFLAKSSFGSQDGVVYGLVARSKTSGMILDTYKGTGTLTFPEGAVVSKSFSYQLPTYLSDAADVFLTLYTSTGVTLAVHKVAEVSKGKAEAVCSYAEGSITCTSPQNATLSISASAGSPQGEIVARKEVALVPNEASSVKLSSLLEDVDAGVYVVSGTVIAHGKTTGKIVKEYVKVGPVARIMSVSAVNEAGKNGNQMTATVYMQIYNQATSSTFSLSAISQGCAEAVGVPVTKKPVAEITFSSSCSNGTLTVNLSKNGKVVDTATTSFALPAGKAATSSATLSFYVGLAGLILLGILVVWAIIRKGLVPGAAGTAVMLLLAANGIVGAAQPAYAGTASLYQTVDTQFYAGGPGSEVTDAGSFTGNATITWPDSVVANSTYTVTVSQSMGGSSSVAGCRDSSTDSYACDSADLKTDFYIGGSLWVSAAHTTSGSASRTAPASGSISLSAYVNLWAPYDFGCEYSYMNPVTKCGLVYDNAGNSGSVSIPVTAAPTVSVYFSFLESVKETIKNSFTAFAAER